MAALLGGVQGNTSEATRQANRVITTRAQTWDVQVRVDMNKDGHAVVELRELQGIKRKIIFDGDVQDFLDAESWMPAAGSHDV